MSKILNFPVCFWIILDELSAGQKYIVDKKKSTTSDVSTMAPSYSPGPDESHNLDEKDGSINNTNNDTQNIMSNGNFPYDLTPKHHIRSPIIEETESGVEAELLRSRGNVLSSSFNG